MTSVAAQWALAATLLELAVAKGHRQEARLANRITTCRTPAGLPWLPPSERCLGFRANMPAAEHETHNAGSNRRSELGTRGGCQLATWREFFSWRTCRLAGAAAAETHPTVKAQGGQEAGTQKCHLGNRCQQRRSVCIAQVGNGQGRPGPTSGEGSSACRPPGAGGPGPAPQPSTTSPTALFTTT